MPLLTQRRVLLSKQETTWGTPVTLTSGTDGMINAYDVMMQGDISYNERPSYGGFGVLQGVTGTRAGGLKFKMPAYGSGIAGTPPAWANVLLPACGMSVSTGLFSPVSAAAAQKANTFGVYEDGFLKTFTGAMGTWTFHGENGKIPYFDFDFKGVWLAPTDVAMATPQYSTVLPPRFQAITLTIGGSYPAPMSKTTINWGANVTLRQDETNAAGFISAIIAGRKVTGSIDPELTSVASYDIFGTWTAGTTAALSVAFGSSGTGMTIAAPAIQYEKVQEAERNKLVTSDASFIATQNGSTVDSELTIQF